MKIGRRVDSNHGKIRTALRAAGCFVVDLSQCGRGIPDLLACSSRAPERVVLLEVKSGPKEKLTEDEKQFFASYPGPAARVETVEEALEVLGLPGGNRNAHAIAKNSSNEP